MICLVNFATIFKSHKPVPTNSIHVPRQVTNITPPPIYRQLLSSRNISDPYHNRELRDDNAETSVFWRRPVESGWKLKISPDVRWCQREFPSINITLSQKCKHSSPQTLMNLQYIVIYLNDFPYTLTLWVTVQLILELDSWTGRRHVDRCYPMLGE